MITDETHGFRPLDRPDCLWRLTHAVVGRVAGAGCGGRASPQAASTGLGSTGFRLAPALPAARVMRARASGLCSLGS